MLCGCPALAVSADLLRGKGARGGTLNPPSGRPGIARCRRVPGCPSQQRPAQGRGRGQQTQPASPTKAGPCLLLHLSLEGRSVIHSPPALLPPTHLTSHPLPQPSHLSRRGSCLETESPTPFATVGLGPARCPPQHLQSSSHGVRQPLLPRRPRQPAGLLLTPGVQRDWPQRGWGRQGEGTTESCLQQERLLPRKATQKQH